ncbi:MAG: GYD domain-containing protein [Terriglobia bacterium]
MPTYIAMSKFTQKGIQHIKESPTRLDTVKKAFQARGGKVKDFFLVLGAYDAVVIFEAPNDERVAEMMLTLGAGGNVRTETLRAFSEDEYRRIIAAVTLD